jgi:hypothetical protein
LPPVLAEVEELLLGELVELDPPHATSTSAVAAPSNKAAAALVYLFTDPPPQEVRIPRGRNLPPTRSRMPAQEGREHQA